MTDDIVVRLRDAGWNEYPSTNIALCAEAVEEIERLRAELALAVKWRDNYKLAWERATGQAVRGDQT